MVVDGLRMKIKMMVVKAISGDALDADCCLFVFGHDVDVFDDADWR